MNENEASKKEQEVIKQQAQKQKEERENQEEQKNEKERIGKDTQKETKRLEEERKKETERIQKENEKASEKRRQTDRDRKEQKQLQEELKARAEMEQAMNRANEEPLRGGYTSTKADAQNRARKMELDIKHRKDGSKEERWGEAWKDHFKATQGKQDYYKTIEKHDTLEVKTEQLDKLNKSIEKTNDKTMIKKYQTTKEGIEKDIERDYGISKEKPKFMQSKDKTRAQEKDYREKLQGKLQNLSEEKEQAIETLKKYQPQKNIKAEKSVQDKGKDKLKSQENTKEQNNYRSR